jgi:hypothetical protein
MQRISFRPVETIANGDCLFAAFWMAYNSNLVRHFALPANFQNFNYQKSMASLVRRDVTNFMLNDLEFAKTWNNYGASPLTERDATSIIHTINANRSVSNLEREKLLNLLLSVVLHPSHDANNAARTRRKQAYVAIMSRPGIWAGQLEIIALSMLYGVPIAVVYGPVRGVGRGIVNVNVRNRDIWLFGAHHEKPTVYIRLKNENHYEALIPVTAPRR